MPIEEAGGFCDYCQRPVLGRRQGVNHVLYAILTIFSCGIWGLVWFLQSAFGGEPYACPTCGGFVRPGARGPLPPPDPNAPPIPATVPQNVILKRVLGVGLGVACLAVVTVISWIGSEKKPTGPASAVDTPAVPPEITAVTRAIVLTDTKDLQATRAATFRKVLEDQSRECWKIAGVRMKHRGPITAWTVTCFPPKSYLLEYNEKGELVGASPINP